MKDPRDGKTYKTVKMPDGKTWMAENLNYNAKGSMCYDNNPANCEKYGRLYTWDAAVDACPVGWRLPSADEFERLLANAGSSDKEKSLNLRAGSWKRGEDKFGFSALPAGIYSSYSKKFYSLGGYADFWSSTEGSSNGAYDLVVSDGGANVYSGDKADGLSVRCLKDSNEGGGATSPRSQATPPSEGNVDYGTMNDPRDAQTYKTVKIGKQVWMAQNLNYKADGSMCYDNNPANCKRYGRLYTWEAALNACPSGWHLPSEEEFEALLESVGESREERTKNLRSSEWKNGSDQFGFSALPAGYYGSSSKEFFALGRYADFWSSTEDGSNYAYYLDIGGGGAYVSRSTKSNGSSVRCLKDSN
ncbi:MAG: fibrobacter succinogenes major paralogous domain-containing protein [Fibrobacter sp.]|nr:fibrobacter succinogenes major paralogous domain-containing protein [Fibrobacter sp.]